MKFTNSPLVDYTSISPNKNDSKHTQRTHAIDTVTIHCYVGQASVESMAQWLCSSEAEASSNYGIGKDGRIGMFVEEKDRSWCSSSPSNDNRAITIECASERHAPFAVNDAVYASLIRLLADICKRNGIKELKWKGDKSLIGHIDQQNMTVHKWFKNKDCPGEYLYSRHGQIADAVNELLNHKAEVNIPDCCPFMVNVLIDDLNYRATPSMDGAVMGQTGKGVFTITDVSNGWGKLLSGVGWIWLGEPRYCAIQDGSEDAPEDCPKPSEPYLVRIMANSLYIRKGPGVNNSITGAINGGGVYTIVEESDGWGKLKSGTGWIKLSYTKKI